jgi:hypothetical protein
MEKSESIVNLAKALMLFHIKVGKVTKDASNPFFKSKYATLENILEVIDIPLNESGLTFTQFPSNNYGLTTILIHAESGEFISTEYFMEPAKKDPQGAGSVITYQRRYALAAILGLSQEDDDGNSGTHGGKTPEQAEENNKPWLNKNTKEFDGAVEKLASGRTTIQKIREVMKVSKEVETLLNNAVKNLQNAN